MIPPLLSALAWQEADPLGSLELAGGESVLVVLTYMVCAVAWLVPVVLLFWLNTRVRKLEQRIEQLVETRVHPNHDSES